MKIAICDDNYQDANNLISLIGGAHVHRLFSSAEELLIEIEETPVRFDLYLLDIFMKDIDGIELGKRIRRVDDNALICFISSSPDYYAEAFSMYAFQYLVKPVSSESFRKLLERASERFSHDREQSLSLVYREGCISIPYSRILYISSSGHTLAIHCTDGTIKYYTGRLNTIMDTLDETVFARCHQSFIINLYNVSALDGSTFVCGTEYIPISRRYLATVRESYRLSLFKDLD